MDELMWLRVFGGALGSGIDLTAVLAFVAFGVLAFLAPVVGYRERPTGLSASLFLLVGYGVVAVLQFAVQWLQLLDEPAQNLGRRADSSPNVLLLFAFLKLLLLVGAMLSFALGVRALKVRRGPDGGPGGDGW
jgi:hypothetical protein